MIRYFRRRPYYCLPYSSVSLNRPIVHIWLFPQNFLKDVLAPAASIFIHPFLRTGSPSSSKLQLVLFQEHLVSLVIGRLFIWSGHLNEACH